MDTRKLATPPSPETAAPADSRRERLARICFAVTAGVVGAGLVLQVALAAGNDEASFATVPARLVNVFSFFTIQSNVIVVVTSALLALRWDRPSTPFRTWRLTGLVAITITGVVFHLALADLHELTGKEAVADFVLHTASPILTLLGWLIFGPRGQVTGRIVRLAVLFPITWLAYALIRGAFVTDRFGNAYYPYPFLNAHEHGYASISGAVALVAVLFLAVAYGVLALDRRLPHPISTQ